MNNSRWIRWIIPFVVTFSLVSCQQKGNLLKEGDWRGVFSLTENEIPFLFEVRGQTPERTTVYLLNGADKFPLKNITYRNDSVFIPIDLYDAVLKARVDGDQLTGRFVKTATDKPDGGVPFTAKHGKFPRFAVSTEKPEVSLNGTWDLVMGSGDQADKTVGIFEQKASLLTGSILTATGDYRFLEGAVQGRKFMLSAFGGSTPYLLKGEFSSDSTFTGEFVTSRRTTEISGVRNSKAALQDAYDVTYLKEGYTTIDFTFPNLNGEQVALSDSRYTGKVVIVTILGSWCPNCLDENTFLAQWYRENKQRGVEIIGLGFERNGDFEAAKKTLTNLRSRLGIQYEILVAGQSGKDNASKALPALNGIASFPTTIFIDKKGNVRKVHSGFSGPATGKFYDEFKAEFNVLIDQLLAEK